MASSMFGQQLKGLYFKDIVGTKWNGGANYFDSSFFNSKYIGLALIKSEKDSIKNDFYIWTFLKNHVVLTLKQDTLIKLDYKINEEQRSIIFTNSEDSIRFTYTPVSSGYFVGLHTTNTYEIIGKAHNSKDGAIIISGETVYLIDEKNEWKESHIGHTIKVQGQIISVANLTKYDLGYDTELIKQGRLGKTVKIKLKGKIRIVN